ncbi:glycosyltransferase, partial [Planctomycetota bacterium]
AKQRPNLRFIEYVTQIDRYFNEAHVLVNTSEYEGFPNTFIQAAKNKTPLLSFKVNPDNFINRYQCGFCAEGNFDQMVGKLKALLENEALHNKMGENAFRYAKQYHDINKIVPKFKKLLQSLVIGSQVPNEED